MFLFQARQALQQGALQTWTGFTSCSANEKIASQSGTYTLHIHGVYGRDISEFSSHPHEKEVLFVPGTCMRVMEVSDTHCVLQESMFQRDQFIYLMQFLSSLTYHFGYR